MKTKLIQELWALSCDYELQDNDIYSYNDFVEYCNNYSITELKAFLQEEKLYQ